MIVQDYLRVCGHVERLSLDVTHPYYQRKLECIARTRCRACADQIKLQQSLEAAKRKAKRREDEIINHKQHIKHMKIKAQETKPKNKTIIQITIWEE